MKILILRQPFGIVQGVALKWYRPGIVYDLPATLAAYLVTEGFGMVEMRSGEPQPKPSPVEPDRRRKPVPPNPLRQGKRT